MQTLWYKYIYVKRHIDIKTIIYIYAHNDAVYTCSNIYIYMCICARMHVVNEAHGGVLFASLRQDAIDQVQSRMTETVSCLLKFSSHNWKISQMGPSEDH